MDQMVILEEDPENIQRKQTCMDLCRIHMKANGKSKCSVWKETTTKLSQHDLEVSY